MLAALPSAQAASHTQCSHACTDGNLLCPCGQVSALQCRMEAADAAARQAAEGAAAELSLARRQLQEAERQHASGSQAAQGGCNGSSMHTATQTSEGLLDNSTQTSAGDSSQPVADAAAHDPHSVGSAASAQGSSSSQGSSISREPAATQRRPGKLKAQRKTLRKLRQAAKAPQGHVSFAVAALAAGVQARSMHASKRHPSSASKSAERVAGEPEPALAGDHAISQLPVRESDANCAWTGPSDHVASSRMSSCISSPAAEHQHEASLMAGLAAALQPLQYSSPHTLQDRGVGHGWQHTSPGLQASATPPETPFMPGSYAHTPGSGTMHGLQFGQRLPVPGAGPAVLRHPGSGQMRRETPVEFSRWRPLKYSAGACNSGGKLRELFGRSR